MNAWWLIGILLVLTSIACAVMVYPVRRQPVLSILLTLAIFIATSTAYYFWGGFLQWQNYINASKSQALAQQILRSIKSPQELIDKLRAQLDDSPKSAKGWYLLGRLYTSQNRPEEAYTAFAKAYGFKPQDEAFAVNYAYSLWQKNNQQFNSELIAIFKDLLLKNPKQPDALAMLAMHAYLNHNYEKAIHYWQRLLLLAPAQSEEALAIRKAIAKAQEQL